MSEKEMLDEFKTQAKQLIKERERFEDKSGKLTVGLESEIAIHGHCNLSELVQKRDKVIELNSDCTDVELGASQIEIRTPPVDLIKKRGVERMIRIYEESFKKVLSSAQDQGVGVLRVGSNPFLPIRNTPRTNKPKYHMVPDFYNRNRDPKLDTTIGLGKHRIDIGDAAIVSLFQSFQINLGAKSLEDACDKMNRSLVIAPYLLAFTGNARYLNFLDTNIQDSRMLSWQKSHDTRVFCDTKFSDLRIPSWEKSFDIRNSTTGAWDNELRVGLPGRYFKNIKDYLDRAGSFPFILHSPESALAIAIGMTWLDARVKFIGDSAIVELRLLSTQPTVNEEMLLTLLYVGRLNYSQIHNEPLLPISLVRENRLSAMLFGKKRPMWFLNHQQKPVKISAKEGIKVELKRAVEGLEHLDLLKHLNRDLLDLVLIQGSPSDRLAEELKNKKHISIQDMEDALIKTNMLLS